MRKKEQQVQSKTPKYLHPLILIGLVIGAFLLRVIPQWNNIFIDGQVIFRGMDAWYHMRLVDNIMANFPIPIKWDMFILYPEGMAVGYFPIMSWIIALPGQIFNYEYVGALVPSILGALVLVPTYFICKKLWLPWVGLIACGLLALTPSEFLHRTLLGFADHHVLEVLFSVLTILFLILMHQEGKLRWTILSGLSLGLYLSSWAGGLLLYVPILIWFLIVFFQKLRLGEATKPICLNLSIVFSLGFMVYLPNIAFMEVGRLPLIPGLLVLLPIGLFFLSRRLKWKALLLVTVGIIPLGLLLGNILVPNILGTVRAVFIDPGTAIQEAMPTGLRVLMNHYGLSFLLSSVGLVVAIKRKETTLLIVWWIFMLLLMLGQRRWGYYFTVNNAIMASYFIYLVVGWMHKDLRVAGPVVICSFLLFTSLPHTIGMAKIPHLMSSNWYNACVWLEQNTPEIEGYYSLETGELDYGVLSWWDYGNWITRIGRRPPISNPMAQTPRIQWEVLLAKSEEEAESLLEGINYIIVDEAMVTGKLWAIVKLSPYEDIDWKPFVQMLWDNETSIWTEIYRKGEVRIYGRQET